MLIQDNFFINAYSIQDSIAIFNAYSIQDSIATLGDAKKL